MFRLKQIDSETWAFYHNNVELFKSNYEVCKRVLDDWQRASEPDIFQDYEIALNQTQGVYPPIKKCFDCNGTPIYCVPETGYWYTTSLDVSDAEFDIRTVCSYLVAGREFPDPKIRERVLSMTHEQIFLEAYEHNLIRFVGAYVVPVKITINYGEIK